MMQLEEKVLNPLPQFIKQDVINILEIYSKKESIESFEKEIQKMQEFLLCVCSIKEGVYKNQFVK